MSSRERSQAKNYACQSYEHTMLRVYIAMQNLRTGKRGNCVRPHSSVHLIVKIVHGEVDARARAGVRRRTRGKRQTVRDLAGKPGLYVS